MDSPLLEKKQHQRSCFRAAVLFLSAAFVAVGVAFMLTLPRAMPG